MESVIRYWYRNRASENTIESLRNRFGPSEDELVNALMRVPFADLPREIVGNSRMRKGVFGGTSHNGISLDVLKSGLQKYCRRNMEEKAIWCALELDLFAYEGQSEAIRTNLIHRLMIIFMEDVGLANVMAWDQVDQYVVQLIKYQKSKDDCFRQCREMEVSLLLKLVSLLCRSKHSRMVSHCNTVFGRCVENSQLRDLIDDGPLKAGLSDLKYQTPIHPFRLLPGDEPSAGEINSLVACLENNSDMSIAWALKVARGPNLATRNRSKKPEGVIFEILKSKTQNNLRLKKIWTIGVAWFREIKTNEKYLCWMLPLLAYLRRDDLADTVVDTGTGLNADTGPDIGETMWKNVSGKKIEIDSFVVDMHTREGARSGMGPIQFSEEGSFVANEAMISAEYKKIYDKVKRYDAISGDNAKHNNTKHNTKDKSTVIVGSKLDDSGITNQNGQNESEVFQFLVRCQLVCGNAKEDTYLAIERSTGKRIFVKGPFARKSALQKPQLISRIRPFFSGINTIPTRLFLLKPDLFPDTPLGDRKRIKDRTKCYPFLVSDCIVSPDEEIPRMMHSSKLWPATEVVDWEKVKTLRFANVEILRKNPAIMDQFALAVLFRYVIGIGDAATRNFLITADNVLFSIDDESWMSDKSQLALLKRARCEMMHSWVKANYKTKVMCRVAEWQQAFDVNRDKFGELGEFVARRLAIIANAETTVALFQSS